MYLFFLGIHTRVYLYVYKYTAASRSCIALLFVFNFYFRDSNSVSSPLSLVHRLPPENTFTCEPAAYHRCSNGVQETGR